MFIDGDLNGLDLGTGVVDFNDTAEVRFFSGNGQEGALYDDIPDFLITQIANVDPTKTDIYYYADLNWQYCRKTY